jgi:hypothetical protein
MGRVEQLKAMDRLYVTEKQSLKGYASKKNFSKLLKESGKVDSTVMEIIRNIDNTKTVEDGLWYIYTYYSYEKPIFIVGYQDLALPNILWLGIGNYLIELVLSGGYKYIPTKFYALDEDTRAKAEMLGTIDIETPKLIELYNKNKMECWVG